MSKYRQKSGKSFHIATCNLLNLALPDRVYYDNMNPYTPLQYKNKINGLTDILKHATSDVWALQEVWDEQALQELAENLGFSHSQVLAPLASNVSTSQLTQGNGAQKTPATAIISRFEIVDWQLLKDFDPQAIVTVPDDGLYQAFNRPPLLVTLNVFGQLITVISAHLKSKRPHYIRDSLGNRLEDYDDPMLRVRAKLRSLIMRGAEAAALRLAIIEKLQNTHHPLILLGDMNDVTDSVTTQLMAETNEVVYDKAYRDTALFSAAKVQTDYGYMQNVAYTHIYQGMPETIDQLFVSEEFLVDSKFSLGEVEKVSYFNDHLKRDYTQRFTDHGIVSAKIRINGHT